MEKVSSPAKYAEFFATVDRSRKRRVLKPGKAHRPMRPKVRIVVPERVPEFVQTVVNDPAMDLVERAFVALLLGSGGRISEILALKKRDFDGRFFKLVVLKKDQETARKQKELLAAGKEVVEWTPIDRKAKIPTVAEGVVAELLSHRRPHEKLFRFSRFQALRIVKRLFGDDMENHSFRHTYVSWLGADLDSKPKKERHEIADILKMSEGNVGRYFHIANIEKELDSLGL